MIVELAVVGSVAVVSSLALTARIVRLSLEAEGVFAPLPPPRPPLKPGAIAEKRRVLERDRAEWAKAYATGSTATPGMKGEATARVEAIDRALLALADEDRE